MGLRPDQVGGHSFGDVTALHVAGVLSESDLLRVAEDLTAAIGRAEDRGIYLDVAMVYALLSFLGVIVVARYIERGF